MKLLIISAVTVACVCGVICWRCMRTKGLPMSWKKQLSLKELNMKLSEVKALVASAAGKSSEAFSEIGTRIAALQQQIDDLINGAGDPDVTDEAFLADLNTLKANTDSLADMVPNPEPTTTTSE